MDIKTAKDMAKRMLRTSIGTAYYKLENENLTEEEIKLVSKYIDKYGTAACKAFGEQYIAY